MKYNLTIIILIWISVITISFSQEESKISVVTELGIPNRFVLHPAYPNPFNPMTTIRYDLPESDLVQIAIYDITGREVANLINTIQDEGYHRINWDATSYSSGAYFVKMTAGDFTQTQKIMLVK